MEKFIDTGYTTLRRFASLADDRASFRAALAQDYDLPADTAAGRLGQAVAVDAWETARELVAKEAELRAENKVQNVARTSTVQERSAMRKAYETKWEKLPNGEVPSAEYLSSKLEETEQEEPSASSLDEVCSIEDSENQSLTASLDSSGRLRIVKQKAKGRLPQSSEELRIKLRLEGNTWLFLGTKFTSKTWLQNLSPNTWSRYADFLLGEKCYNLVIPSVTASSTTPVKPPWSVILHYELQLRKRAFQLVRENGTRIDDALTEAMKDAELKEVHFTSPLALMGPQKRRQDIEQPNGGKWQKGQGKGKKGQQGATGAKGKGGKGRGKDKGSGKTVATTDDGRQICFAYNSADGCSTANCSRVHVCRIRGCSAAHPMQEHPA